MKEKGNGRMGKERGRRFVDRERVKRGEREKEAERRREILLINNTVYSYSKKLAN